MKVFFNNKQNIFTLILFFICLVLSVGMIHGFYIDKEKSIQNTLDSADKKISNSLDYVESKLKVVEKLGKEIAQEISEKKPSDNELENIIIQLAEKNDFLNGICVAFRPFKAVNGKKLYAPYYHKNSSEKFQMTYLEDRYDYADGTNDWFELPLKQGAIWHGPFYGKASEKYVVEYNIPVSIREKHDAVVSVNYSMSDIKKFMTKNDMDGSGYSTIITSTGQFVYHPVMDLVSGKKNVFKLAEESKNAVLKNAVEHVLQGGAGRDEYTSPVSGLKGWLLYRPLETAGWAVLSVVGRHDAQLGEDHLKKRGMQISFVLILTFCLFCLVFVKRYWMRIILWTFAIIVGIGTIWYMVLNSSEETGNIISSEVALEKFKKKQESVILKKYLQPSVFFIPTGLFIQSVEYKGSNNVEITGYIWQKYKKGLNLKKGVIFPEAVNFFIKEKYNKVYTDYEVTGWYFQVTVRERFDYSKYPFDKDNLWIRIRHKSFYNNIILVPDLKSYQLKNPESLPGIEPDIVTQGKIIVSSFYSYKYNSYNTDFGLKNFMGQKRFPELYYNISTKRKFLDAFIAHLIPLIVVISLLYFILLMNIHEKSHALNVLAACSGLFFVAIFDHIGLRRSLSASGIFYLEYFYFITYFAILGVSVNSYLYGFHVNLRLVSYRENIYPRVYFWPVITGVLYVITFIVYY